MTPPFWHSAFHYIIYLSTQQQKTKGSLPSDNMHKNTIANRSVCEGSSNIARISRWRHLLYTSNTIQTVTCHRTSMPTFTYCSQMKTNQSYNYIPKFLNPLLLPNLPAVQMFFLHNQLVSVLKPANSTAGLFVEIAQRLQGKSVHLEDCGWG